MGIGGYCYVHVNDIVVPDWLDEQLVYSFVKGGAGYTFEDFSENCMDLAREVRSGNIKSAAAQTGEDEFVVLILVHSKRGHKGFTPSGYISIFFEPVFHPELVGERDIRVSLGF